jgi:uncharacterized membrane protein
MIYFYFIISGVVHGRRNSHYHSCMSVRLYLWETVVTPRGVSSVVMLLI